MRVILASHNEGKLAELRQLFAELDWQLQSQADHQVPAAVEDGLTFVENALLKARAVCRATGLPAIADDSGLVVPALGGAPGIYSARFAGTHGDDAANNRKLLQMLANESERHAYFFCAMAFLLHADDPTPIIASAAWHGSILQEPRGSEGFGYDPLFLVAGLGQSSAELPAAKKNRLSHRGQASRHLLAALKHRQARTEPQFPAGSD